MLRAFTILAVMLLSGPALAEERERPSRVCKHECGQDASRCRMQCKDGNRSRCVNACQGKLYECQSRCQSGGKCATVWPDS